LLQDFCKFNFNYDEVSELKDEVTLKKLFCDHVIMQHRYCHTRLFYRKKTYM